MDLRSDRPPKNGHVAKKGPQQLKKLPFDYFL